MPARPQPPRVTPAPPKFARAVYALVRRVPRGRVVTYGQVAAILGHPRAARAVGTALSNLPASLKHIVPWQRVINASGGVSARGDVLRPDLQRELLELEGVMQRGRVDLARYRWSGPKREQRVALRVELPLSEGRLRRAGGRKGVKSTRS
jgi:methylated-DNA-protein-cysteine methyltransferase-like protein